MVLHFVLGKVGKMQGKQQPHFQIISDFGHLYRSAMMHVTMNMSILCKSSQIISNNFRSRHIWTCQNMDMSKFSKRCLQRTDAALQVSV